jgi:hypothetical protein
VAETTFFGQRSGDGEVANLQAAQFPAPGRRRPLSRRFFWPLTWTRESSRRVRLARTTETDSKFVSLCGNNPYKERPKESRYEESSSRETGAKCGSVCAIDALADKKVHLIQPAAFFPSKSLVVLFLVMGGPISRPVSRRFVVRIARVVAAVMTDCLGHPTRVPCLSCADRREFLCHGVRRRVLNLQGGR